MTEGAKKISFIGDHLNIIQEEPVKPPNSKVITNNFITSLPPITSPSLKKERSSTKASQNQEKPENSGIPIFPTFLDFDFIEKSDILTIDQKIRKFLQERVSNLEILKKRREELKWIAENLSRYERRLALNELFILEKKISTIDQNKEIDSYITAVEPILDHYRNNIPEISIKCFISSFSEESAHEEEETLLRMKYLSIVNKFIEGGIDLFNSLSLEHLNAHSSGNKGTYHIENNIESNNYSKNDNRSASSIKKSSNSPYSGEERCLECKSTNFYCVNESTILCCNCGLYGDRVNLKLAFKDTDRIDLVPRFNYTKRGHMEEALQDYQGKQNTTIPQEVLDLLKEETRKNKISLDELTKKHLYIFLSQNGYGGHYENINLIHHLLTGVPCPDISEYEEIILERNEQIEQIYNTVKKSERKNSLNIYYKLWKICESLNLPVNRDDFCFLKTDLKIKEHDEVCRKIFLRLGWYFIDTEL